jgi:hypothetical protein
LATLKVRSQRRCIAPLGDDPAAAQNEAVRAAARRNRPERLVPRRLFAEIGRDAWAKIAAPRRLVLGGVMRGGGKRTGVETAASGAAALPTRLDWRRNIGHEVLSDAGLDFRPIGTTS